MANGVQYKAVSISEVYYSSSTVMLSAESAGVASRTISRAAAVTIMSFLTEPPAPPGAGRRDVSGRPPDPRLRVLQGGAAAVVEALPVQVDLVPPDGLDHVKTLQKWLEQYPNDIMVRSKLAEIQRDPRFAEPDEPDDIMPQIPELAEVPVPPGIKKYIDATRIVAGASVPTSAACIAAAFNLLAAEDIDVQSRANAPHPSGLYFVVGSESGGRARRSGKP